MSATGHKKVSKLFKMINRKGKSSVSGVVLNEWHIPAMSDKPNLLSHDITSYAVKYFFNS